MILNRMTNQKMTKLLPRSVTWLLSITFFSIFISSCSEDSPDLGKIEYSLKNSSEVSIGFKVYLLSTANATIVKDSFVIKSEEDLVIIKSHTSQTPKSLIKKIEIWNSDFSEKYKVVELDNYIQLNNRYTLSVNLPHRGASEITSFYSSVHIYMDQTSLYGFYPKVNYPRTTYFFRTLNNFQEVFKTQTPTGTLSADFKLIDAFESTLIAYNASEYADKTLFIKSNNNGVTWETYFEFGFSTSDDAFTATDFINESKGWFFNYKTVFNGQYANTYATDVYKYNSGNISKISTIDNYCVYLCKFINETTGYLLANQSNNTIPPDIPQTFLFKTLDGGVTWSEPVLISDNQKASFIFKLNDGKLITFFSSSYPLLKEYKVSTDDGETWQSVNVPTEEGIRDLFFLPNGVGYLKTGTIALWSFQNIGAVYKTINGGTTWTKLTEDISGSKVWFYDENIGYLQDLIYGQGQILYTTKNGGTTWTEVLYPYDYLIE